MKEIFINHGLGDFFALCSFLTQEEKNQIHTIYYATRARQLIQAFSKIFFPNLKTEISLFDNWKSFEEAEKFKILKNHDKFYNFCVDNFDDLFVLFEINRLNTKLLTKIKDNIVDLSIANKVFDYYGKQNNNLEELIDLKIKTKFGFKDYYFIHPHSDNQLQIHRDLDPIDKTEIIQFLKNNNSIGVINNYSKNGFGLENDLIVDLTNKASLLESVQLLKNATGYIGIGSCWSVIADKIFTNKNIKIKHSLLYEKNIHKELNYFYFPNNYNNNIVYENFHNINKSFLYFFIGLQNDINVCKKELSNYQKLFPDFSVKIIFITFDINSQSNNNIIAITVKNIYQDIKKIDLDALNISKSDIVIGLHHEEIYSKTFNELCKLRNILFYYSQVVSDKIQLSNDTQVMINYLKNFNSILK